MLKDLKIKDLHNFYIVEGGNESIELIQKLFSEVGSGTENFSKQSFEKFSVDDVREFTANLNLKNECKNFYVIETKEIPHEAQNALLKITEEPVEDLHIFIIIPDISQILPTLASRGEIIYDVNENSKKIAQEFLGIKLADKFEWIKDFVKKHKEEGESSTLLRNETKKLLDAIEVITHEKFNKDNIENKKKIEFFTTLYEFRHFLFTPGSSPKMILEHVAMMCE